MGFEHTTANDGGESATELLHALVAPERFILLAVAAKRKAVNWPVATGASVFWNSRVGWVKAVSLKSWAIRHFAKAPSSTEAVPFASGDFYIRHTVLARYVPRVMFIP